MKAELFLRITQEDSKGKLHEDGYYLERVAHIPGETKLVWDLRKEKEPKDERPRTVMVHVDGRITCDCQYYELGRKICKHIKALLDRGLLPKRG